MSNFQGSWWGNHGDSLVRGPRIVSDPQPVTPIGTSGTHPMHNYVQLAEQTHRGSRSFGR